MVGPIPALAINRKNLLRVLRNVTQIICGKDIKPEDYIMQLFYVSLTFFMGIMIAVYLPANSVVARHLGSPISALIPFFFIALVTTIILLF